MDYFKEVGYGAYAYYAKVGGTSTGSPGPPKQMLIEPILFLNRKLTVAEKNYWFTELKVFGLVWVIRKLRYMVESSELLVIVFTDHSSTCQIARQTSLDTVSIEKLNFKLVRFSEFLQRFRLDVRYRSGVSNIILDALSRLPRQSSSSN